MYSRYDRCCQPSVCGLGNGNSFAVPSAINWPASFREAPLSLVRIHPADTVISGRSPSGRSPSMPSGSNFGYVESLTS
jgi:hypothetical protein